MQIKLIAMDLDGTLMLPDHQQVGEATRRALAACRQQGVRLALATGRHSYCGLVKFTVG